MNLYGYIDDLRIILRFLNRLLVLILKGPEKYARKFSLRKHKNNFRGFLSGKTNK